MVEFLAGLLAIFMALGVLALMGHGLWLAASWFVRLVGGGQGTTSERRCPRCSRPPAGAANCPECAWPFPPQAQHAAKLAPSTAGLRGLRAHLQRLLEAGAIDAATHTQLCTVIAENERRLLAAAAVPAAPVAQVVAPVAKAEPAPAIPVAEAVAATASPLPAPAREVAARAREFAARLAQPPEPPVAPAPRRATKPFAQLLAAFLEEKNIRWGELAGGLLIVGCSIALVISFWAEIAQRPFLKFVVFGGVTASVFAAGLYTERRWKLPTTSRGLFAIGALLVPLNFLAIAAFERGATAPPVWMIAGELLTIGLFGWLLTLAGRNLASAWPRWLAAGVLVPSTLQLLVRRFAGPDMQESVAWALAAGIVAPYVLAGVASSHAKSSPSETGDAWAAAPLRLLGATSFAVLVALGLLLTKSEQPADLLRLLAPAATLLAAPAWLVGLSLWKQARQRTDASYATTGAALAVAAAGISFAGIVGAWPNPLGMIAAALATAALMAYAALSLRLAPAWLPACVCGTWAYLLAAQLGLGRISLSAGAGALTQELLSAPTGNLLMAPALFLAAVAFALRRKDHPENAAWIERAGMTVGLASAGLLGWFGLGREGDPFGVTWSLLAYAIAAGAAALRLNRAGLASLATLLGFAAAAQGCVFGVGLRMGLEHPWSIALLLMGTAATLASLSWGQRLSANVARSAFAGGAQLALTLVAAPIAWIAATESSAAALPLACWATAAWLTLGVARRERHGFAVGQAVLVATTILGVGAALEGRTWWQQAAWPWLDPWTLEALAAALALLALSWQALRVGMRRSGWAALFDQKPTLDQTLHVPVLALATLLAIYAVLPTAAQELTPKLAALAMGAAETGGRVVAPSGAFELHFSPAAHLAGWGGWGLAAVVAGLGFAQWRSRRTNFTAEAIVLAAWTFCLWGAAAAASAVAAATALRWLTAGFVLLTALAAWLWRSEREPSALQARAWPVAISLGSLTWALMGIYVAAMALAYRPLPIEVWQGLAVTAGLAVIAAAGAVGARWTSSRAATGSAVLGMLGALPLSATVLYAVTIALAGNPIAGPDPASWIGRLGVTSAYVGPLALVIAALISEAVRRRSEAYALAAGLLTNVAATAGYLLALRGSAPFDAVLWVRLAQLNAAVAAGFGLAWWLSARRRAEEEAAAPLVLLDAQLRLGAAIVATALGCLLAALWFAPVHLAPQAVSANVWGWLSAGLAFAAFFVAERQCGRRLTPELVFGIASLTLCLTTNAFAPWDHGQWLVYHAALVGWLLLAAGFAAAATLRGGREAAALAVGRFEPLAAGAGMIALAFAIRAVVDDPQAPWWSVGGFVGCAALAVWFADRVARRSPVWLAAGLLNAAASLTWWKLRGPVAPHTWVEIALVNVLALAAPAAAWLVLELRSIRPRRPRGAWGLEMHRAAAAGSLAVLMLVAIDGLWHDALGQTQIGLPWLTALAWLASLSAGVSCLWDARSKWGATGLYLLGVSGLALLLDSLNVTGDRLVWSGAMLAAAYSVGASYLWSRRGGLIQLGAQLGMPAAGRERGWIVPATATLGLGAAGLAFLAVLTFADATLRISAAQAILAQGVALGLLAEGRYRKSLTTAALGAVAVGAVALGWASISPEMSAAWLHRGVASMVALAMVATVYGLGLNKLLRAENDWAQAAQRIAPWLLGAAGVALVRVLATEAFYFVDGAAVPMKLPAIAAVGLALVGLAGAALAAALLPGRDPLGLLEKGRTAYVYAAEALLTLAFLHVRLTMPWLFSGFWRAWWPFLAMLIAFAGVALSELFRRLRQPVLSEPLERTAVFLPLLPVLGFWAAPGEGHYSLLLLSVSGLYAALALLRRSLGFGVLALVAAHGGFWYFLSHDTSLQLWQHPQLWLIPPAVCTLIGAYLNRDRLTAEQMTQIRYLASIVIYASSTAEMFITGVAQAPWLPLVLAGLSLAGLFAGILLRVRAFLYLGSTFLVVSLLAVIWHAAHDLDQTWVWYASGIVVGTLIIALFATFEKKRHEVLALVDRVRSWEG